MSNVQEKHLSNYRKFMSKYTVQFGPDIPFTHSIVGKPGGKYNIPADKYDDFLDIYIKAYQEGGFHLVERPTEIGPLLIDLDFRQETDDRQYTCADILCIVKYASGLIRKYYKITQSSQVYAFVFEKNKPSKHASRGYKDGFHIVYPNIPMSTNMRYLILSETRDKIIEEGAMSHINYTNDFAKEVFDSTIVKSNGWMIYGANKQNSLPYRLSYIFNHKLDEIDSNNYSFEHLVKLLANRKFETHDEHLLNNKINSVDLKKKIDVMLIKMKTKRDTTKHIKNNDNDEIEDIDDHDTYIANNNNNKKTSTSKLRKYDDIQLATKLVELLSDERATNYTDWTHVGWALYNTSSKLLKTWHNFSKRTKGNNYDESVCTKFWKDPKKSNNKLTIGSLHVWAKTDNPEKYATLMRDNIHEMLLDAETGTEYDIAKIMYELYGHKFVCSDIQRNTWYEFQDNLWVKIQEGYTLYNLISEELSTEFIYLQQSIVGEMLNKKGGERDGAYKRNENIQKLLLKLKRPTFKDGIVVECRRKFVNELFEEKLDSNTKLIGFNDGIYDLENNCFRKGFPEDYVSFTVGYNYPREYNINHPDVQWVESYLSRVQVDHDMNEYLKTLLASYIDGSTANENFLIWTGKGANGKSKTIEFFTKAFGDYCSTLPVTLLTGNRPPSGAATPEMAEMRGKRFVAFEEPEKSDNVKVGYMKELTGGTSITVRKLYGNPFTYKPQFKLLLACNKLPAIDATDGGTWRRLRVSPFNSHFVKVDNPNAKDNKFTYKGKPLGKGQFPRDYQLSENMDIYKKAFSWLIINIYYPLYKQKGLVEPPLVMEYTNKYQKDNDIMLDFINNYGAWKDWIRINGTHVKVGSANDIVRYFEDMDSEFKIKNKKIYGISFKSLEDENMTMN
jgi:P4 family phage/plasmid primase-like protien